MACPSSKSNPPTVDLLFGEYLAPAVFPFLEPILQPSPNLIDNLPISFKDTLHVLITIAR